MPHYKATVKIEQEPSHVNPTAEPVTQRRLVFAKNEATALRYLTESNIAIERASSEDCIEMTAAGIEREVAPDAPPKPQAEKKK